MKVSLPSRVPMPWVLSFVLALMCVQLVEGTPLTLSVTACAFVVIAGLAFNEAGGLQYPSGAYVFFNTIFSSTLGMVGKAVLGEPLQTNLIDAQRTLTIYLLGMCAMYAAVTLNRRVRRKTPLLSDKLSGPQMNAIAAGCVFLYVVPVYLLPAHWGGTYTQFNYFQYLAIMLPVYQLAKDTDGYKTFNWISFLTWLFVTVRFGLMAFSKEGMFAPSAAWVIAAVAAGYRVSLKKAMVLGVSGAVAIVFLTPFSQLGRVYRDQGDVTDVVISMLSHPLETRATYEYLQTEALRSQGGGAYHWFDAPEGLLDRLTVVPVDDALIYATDHGHPGSMVILQSYFTNLIPRYLFPDKPNFLIGNLYGHDIGALPEDDTSTGVSFSAYADAYHVAHWQGVTLILAPLFFMLFFVADSLVGSISQTRWALLYFVWFAHSGGEGLMNALVYGAGTFSVTVVLAQTATTRLGPVLGALAIRPGRGDLRRI